MQLDTPKAILYCWPTSVQALIPRLCLHEKGYTPDEYVIKHVDITKGENFSPQYLSINKDAAVPTLAIPMADSAQGKPAYHYLCDSTSICAFLDDARLPTATTAPARERPPLVLSPLTSQERELTETIIDLVSEACVDPNFLDLTARDEAELSFKLSGPQGTMLVSRRTALRRYMQKAKEDAIHVPNDSLRVPSEHKMVQFLENKNAANQSFIDIYNGENGRSKQPEFFEMSREIWTVFLPSTLSKLEASMIGPFALGDDLTMADLHIIAWLARLVALCGGSCGPAGIYSVETHVGGQRIGPKLVAFWGHWVQRTSFCKVFTASSFPEVHRQTAS